MIVATTARAAAGGACLRRGSGAAVAVARLRDGRRRARSSVAARVASTQEAEAEAAPAVPQGAPAPQGPAYTLFARGDGSDDPAAASNAAAAAAGGPLDYAELRRRPINFSPDTAFSVDNVADVDAVRFRQHPSVLFWRTWGTRLDTRSLGNNIGASRESAAEMGETALGLLTSSALADAESAAYWAYHLGRTGFFFATSAAGALAHHLSERLAGGSRRTPLDNLSTNAQAEVANRVYEAIAMYQQDLAAIKSGAYKLPWDMTTPTHRQFNPLYVARKAAAFVNEAVGTLDRRLNEADTTPWFSSNMYPPYYIANTFHYQTDGWLSSQSAGVYEFSTESLFFGRQDAMQRTALLAISEWLADSGRDPSSLRLLEVSCGTGRFHTFIKDNYPRMQTVASDLSPFYLAQARDNLAYWKARRQPGADLGPGPERAGTTFMQCAAESVPAPDESFDVIVCVYLFHEMPEEARLAAAREWARLLRPGGLVVLADSCQLGDRPAWDATLGAFGSFNEPHYRNYIACDLGALFSAAGLEPRTKYLASATKALAFLKPAAKPAAGPAAEASASAPAAPADPGLN